jgi:hypothetical protein
MLETRKPSYFDESGRSQRPSREVRQESLPCLLFAFCELAERRQEAVKAVPPSIPLAIEMIRHSQEKKSCD